MADNGQTVMADIGDDVRADIGADTILLSYDEISRRLRIKPGSARRLVHRKRWPRRLDNTGNALVAVPRDLLPEAGADVGDDVMADVQADSGADVRAIVAALERQIERLEADLASARTGADRLAVVEQEVAALRAIADAERARAAELKAERDEALRIALARRSWWPFRRSA